MKTVQITLFAFDELSETAKEKAIQTRLKHILPEHKEASRPAIIKRLADFDFLQDGTRFHPFAKNA